MEQLRRVRLTARAGKTYPSVFRETTNDLGSVRSRVARGASNVREHGPAGRDEIKRRIPSSRSHVQLICALARRREPTTDASEHGWHLSSRRANRSSSARACDGSVSQALAIRSLVDSLDRSTRGPRSRV